MSEPGGLDAGPLYVDVVADLTGFSRGLQQKINAEVSRIKASITAEIDTKKVEAQLAALARKEYVVSIKAEAQVAAAQADLDRTTAKQRVAQIKAEAQTTAAKGELDSAAKDRIAKVTLQAQTTAAEAKLTEATAKQRVAEITAEAHVVAAKGELDDTAKDRIAKIEAEAQVATAQADLDRAAAAQRIAQIKAEAQTAGATGELDAAAKDRIAKIEADAQTAVAEAKLTEATAKDRIAKIEADADVARAQAELDAAARDRTVKFKVDTSEIDKAGSSLSGLGTGALGLMQMPAIAAGISMAAQAVVQLAGGLVSVAAAAAPVVGLLGAIPGLVAGAAQGIGSVLVGFMGISAAVKASSAAQAQSGATASATAAQHEAAAARIVAAQDQVKRSQSALANAEANAAYAVKQAQQGVATAHQEAARAIQQAQQGVANAVQQSARNIQQAQQGLVTAHQEAARSIASAEQTVVNAHQQAAAAIATAETQLATSQRAATQAQLDLNKAREEATRQLQDMNDQVAGGRLSVEQDQINVQRAAIERVKVFANPTSTLLDREQADLSYRQSVQSLQDQQIQQQRLEADTTNANKAGVEGSDLVVTAKQRLMDANQKVIDSEKALQDARTQGAQRIVQAEKALQDARLQGAQKVKQAEATLQDARLQGAQKVKQAEATLQDARAQGAQRINQAEVALQDARVQGAQKVAQAEAQLANTRRTSAYSVQQAQQQVVSAQQSLTTAQAAGTTQVQKQTAANVALAKAMGALSPAGRDFVTFLQRTLIPAWQAVQNAVQQALIPPVQAGLTALMPLLGVLQTGMVQTASIIGGAFQRLATSYLATPLFKRDLSSIMASNNRAFQTLGQALVPVVRAVVDLMVASEPLVRRFADFIAYSATLVGNFIHAQRETGNLGRFFKLAGDTAGELWRIVRDLAIAIFNIGKEAYPAGKSLLDSFAGVVSKFREWTTSLSGKNALKDYFNQSKSTVEAVGRLVRDIVIDLFKIGRGGSMAGLIDELRTKVLPVLLPLIQNLNKTFGPALVKTIGDVATLLGDLMNTGPSGGLTSFVTTLDGMVNALDALVKIPGLGPVIAMIFSLGGSLAAISLVAGPAVRGIGGVAGAMTKLAVSLGLVDAEAGALTGTMALLGAAMDIAFGPIGLVVLAIAALAIGFYELYQHWQPFHKLVDDIAGAFKNAAVWIEQGLVKGIERLAHSTAWADIKGAASWLWTGLIKGLQDVANSAVWKFVVHGITGIGDAFSNLKKMLSGPGGSIGGWIAHALSGIGPALANVGSMIKGAWNSAIGGFIKNAFSGIGPALSNVGKMAGSLGGQIKNALGGVGPAFSNVGKMAGSLGGQIKNAWNSISGATGSLRDSLGTAFSKVGGYFTSLGNSIRDTWNRKISTTWTALRNAWNSTRDAFGTGANKIAGFFTGLGNSIRTTWDRVISTTWAALRNAWNSTRDAFGNAANKIAGFFTNLGNSIRNIWNRVISTTWTALRNAWNSTRDAIGNAANRIGGFFTGLGSTIRNVWNATISTTFNAIKTGISKVSDAFRTGVANIGKLWDGLRRATGTPVNFVLGTVYNNGIKKIWDWVASKVGADPLPLAPLLKFARGGVVPGYAPGRDTQHAILSPGEGVLVPEAVRGIARRLGTSAENAISSINSAFAPRLGGVRARISSATPTVANALLAPGEGVLVPEAVRGLARQAGLTAAKTIHQINAAYSPRVRAVPAPAGDANRPPMMPSRNTRQGFDLGGVFNWIIDKVSTGASAVKNTVGDVIGAVKNAVAGALSGVLTAAGGGLKNIVHRVLPTKPPFTWLMRAMSDNLIDRATGWLGGRDQAQNTVASGGGGGVTGTRVPNVGSGVERWRSLVVKALAAQGLSTSLADKVLRQMQTESGGNPNAIQGNIGDINNRTGDLAKGFMQVIGATFRAYHWPGTSNNIFDPWANLMAALNYAKHRYGNSLSFLGQGHGYSLGGVVNSVLGKAAPHRFALGGLLGSSIPTALGNVIQWLTPSNLQFGNVPAAADPGSATGAVNPHQAHQAHLAHLAHLARTATKHVLGIPAAPSASQRHLAHLAHLAHLSHIGRHALGGLVSDGAEKLTRLFDSGGILSPGVSLVENATGKPEVVFTSPQWDTLSRLAGAGASALYHEPTASERGSGAQVDIHVYPTPGMDTHELARKVAVEMAWQMRGA